MSKDIEMQSEDEPLVAKAGSSNTRIGSAQNDVHPSDISDEDKPLVR